MADHSGLRLVGLIFASVTVAVMLTTTIVVKGYSDGGLRLERAAIQGHDYGLSTAASLDSGSRR